MTQRTALVSTLAAAVLLALPAFAQQAEFQGDTSVTVVEVPVHVTRNGEPVRGLTAADFEVLDGRKSLPIVGFEVIDLESVAIAADRPRTEAVPAAARRHFLLLFDLVFSDPKAVNNAREGALAFVRDQMHPTDLAGVALYTARGAELLLGFTSDRRQVELAVHTLGAPQLIERAPDPLALSLGMSAGPMRTAETATSSGGSGADASAGGRGNEAVQEAVQDHLESLVQQEAQTARREQTTRVVGMTRAFSDLARMLGSVEGRKYLMLFSEGFAADLLTGDAGFSTDAGANLARERGEVWNADTDQDFGSSRVQNAVEGMLEEFRRADVVIQAVDAGGLRGAGDVRPRASGTESLLMMARDTGGNLYQIDNDLAAAGSRLNEATSVTYLITVQPDDLKADGKFHKLKVKVDGAGGGADVRHREGFYAPDPALAAAPPVRRMDAAEAILGGEESGDLGAGVLAAPFPSRGTDAYVPVLIEVRGGPLAEGVTGGQVPLEIYSYALRPDGTVADWFNQNLGLDLSKVGDKLRQSGVKYWGHLDLPPGAYSVRTFVRNAATGRSELRVTPVTVPNPGAGSTLVAPLFPEAPDKWLLIPESDRPDVDFPFLMGGQAFIPAARPELPRKGKTTLQLVGYNLPAGSLRGEAQLVGADGAAITALKLDLGAREDAPNGPTRVAANLETAGLAPGSYTLVVKVGVEGGGFETAAIPVTVGG